MQVCGLMRQRAERSKENPFDGALWSAISCGGSLTESTAYAASSSPCYSTRIVGYPCWLERLLSFWALSGEFEPTNTLQVPRSICRVGQAGLFVFSHDERFLLKFILRAEPHPM